LLALSEPDLHKTAKTLFGYLSPKGGSKKSKGFSLLLTQTYILDTGIIVYLTSFKASSTDPAGKISLSKKGSKTFRNIHISGQTENIPPEWPFVVIAVDHKDNNLCRPKKPIIKHNTIKK
jgi:hypothetical protein